LQPGLVVRAQPGVAMQESRLFFKEDAGPQRPLTIPARTSFPDQRCHEAESLFRGAEAERIRISPD